MFLEDLLYWDLHRRGFKSHWVTVDGSRMHYLARQTKSKKAPIVFVHGIGANAVNWHRALVDLAQTDFTILVPDLPGHGWSDEYKGTLSSDILQKIFSDFIALTTKDEKIILIGNSLGGSISLRYAFGYPEKITNLMVISPAGGFEKEEDWEEFKKILDIQNSESAHEFLKKIYAKPPWYFGLFSPVLEKVVIENMKRKAVRDLINQTKVQDFHLGDQLKKLKVPTVFIWGDSENLLPRKSLSWFRTYLPTTVRLEEPSQVGHCPHIDHPIWFKKRLGQFLKQDLA